jgi:hypothetical protein
MEKLRDDFCGRECSQAETRQQERMRSEHAQGTQDFGGESGPVVGEWLHQAAPTIAVRRESRFGGVQVALENYGCAVIKRVSEGSRGVNPVQPVSLQRERRKERGASSERMDSGTEIVEEAGQGKLECARSAAGLRLGFEDVDVSAGLREGDGGGEAVGSGADYGGATN